MFGLKKKRRHQLMQKPLPAGWLEIVHKNVPYVAKLTHGRPSPSSRA